MLYLYVEGFVHTRGFSVIPYISLPIFKSGNSWWLALYLNFFMLHVFTNTLSYPLSRFFYLKKNEFLNWKIFLHKCLHFLKNIFVILFTRVLFALEFTGAQLSYSFFSQWIFIFHRKPTETQEYLAPETTIPENSKPMKLPLK